MRFSILIPVYNVELYLPQCLQSVGAQSFTDFEVVIINDGSTDASLSICETFAAGAEVDVRVVSQSNKGLLMARRAGIDIANGEYLICLDSDDALRSDALSLIDTAIGRTNADVLMFQASRSEGYDVPYFDWSKMNAKTNSAGVLPSKEARRLIATTHNVHSMWGKAIRRSCVGLGDDYSAYEGLQYGEDLLQMTRVFDSAQVFASIPDILYFYRDNQSSISHEVDRRRLDDIVAVRSQLLSYTRRWDENLCSAVMAGNCVEILAYCVMCVNRLGRQEACQEICEAANMPGFKESCYGADFSSTPGWKRLGIKLLSGNQSGLFMLYIRVLFGLLRISKSKAGMRYL